MRLPLTRFQGREGGSVLPPPNIPQPRQQDDTSYPDSDWFGTRKPTPEPPSVQPEKPVAPAKPTANRLLSLDAFRGLTILGMLLVNNIALGDKVPQQLVHAEWSGKVTLADLVFPWFLFIVGVAVPYSQASARRKHLQAWQYDLKALWRAGMLVFLGCLIDSFIAHKPVFDLGVLQVIGLACFVAVLVGGFLTVRWRLIYAAILLAGHWAILKLIPQPGVGAGVFTEQHNVTQWINDTYLKQFNLNGLLSVIPTTAMVIIGTAVGDMLRRKKIEPMAKVANLTVYGAGLTCAGWVLSQKVLGWWALPMNKPCWTATYILFTAGLACIGLALMYLIVDVPKGKWGQWLTFPFIVAGSNAIVAYCAPILTKVAILRNVNSTWPSGKLMNLEDGVHHWFYNEFGRYNGGWTYTLAYMTIWWCVLLFLYRKRWFLRV